MHLFLPIEEFRRQARMTLFLGLYPAFVLIWRPNRAMVSGCTVAAIGFFLNRLVLALNDGFMLVALAEESIPAPLRGGYKPIDSESRAVFLSDWIPLGRGRLTSIGDEAGPPTACPPRSMHHAALDHPTVPHSPTRMSSLTGSSSQPSQQDEVLSAGP
jgi:hypothetical protein